MSNKIITGLMSGNLAGTGKVVFDNTAVGYFVEFASGKVGVFARTARTSFFAYTEITIDGGSVKQSGKPNKDFQVTSSINTLYSAIFANNARIAKQYEDKLGSNAEIDPEFVIGLYYYNPLGKTKLETVDMNRWAIDTTSKAQVAAAKTYFDTANNRREVNEATSVAADKFLSLIQELITENQKAGSNAWTSNGQLSLNIKAALESEKTTQAAFDAAMKLATDKGLTQPTVSDMVTQALSKTDWVLARELNFTVTPFIYLYPKAKESQNTPTPAVPSTDTSTATTSSA